MEKQIIHKEAGQTREDLVRQMKKVTPVDLQEKRAAVVQACMPFVMEGLHHTRKKVSLDDTNAVMEHAVDYCSAAADAGFIPTFAAFCSCLGLSRQRVYAFMRTHPHHATTELLENLQTSIAAVLAQGGLSRAYSEPVSIFLLKNSGQGYSDSQDITIAQAAKYEPTASPEEIAQKYRGLIRGMEDSDTSEDSIDRILENSTEEMPHE